MRDHVNLCKVSRAIGRKLRVNRSPSLRATDLIPELQHDRSARALFAQTGLISLGIAIMGLLTLME